MRNRHRVAVAAVMACALAVAAHARQAATASSVELNHVDAIFHGWTSVTPGCAVAAASNGRPVLEKAYGMADLERGVPNTPDTIFEAGSVSKQFTAAAVLLLAREGKLSLDDPVRKYVPELPDYDARGVAATDRGSADAGTNAGGPTIRNMLTHTSGLRDWGSVEAIAGWPRTTRVYTHAHVLDIVSRQHALNFPPGTQWSYSNTGYNLAAIIVSRVSKLPFADFTRARIFAPLGMTHTSWRDDHTRIVRQRAIAYAEKDDGFHTDMPFEDIYGNGGLLTTVGDLLKWNENFVTPVVGDAAFVAEQQRVGHFTDGRAFNYGLGLFVGPYRGVREVSHSGSTAGYRAFLTRFPDQHVSVAVLCNSATAKPAEYAHAVADLLLGTAVKPQAPAPAVHPSAELEQVQGLYRDDRTGAYFRIGPDSDGPHASARLDLVPGQRWKTDGPGRLVVTDEFGGIETYERVAPAHPTPAELEHLAGTYVSNEAETTFRVTVEGGAVVIKRRPDTTLTLTPVYADTFRTSGMLVRFRRGTDGRVVALSVTESRVWDLRFARQN